MSRADRTESITEAEMQRRFRREDRAQPEADRGPDTPTEVGTSGWWATLRRTVREFKDDNLTDWAAALTYYGVLSLFPAIAALVSLVGLVMDPRTVTDTLTKLVSSLNPDAVKVLRGPIDQITANRSQAGVAFVIALGAALWSASGYVGAFMRASNAIWDVEEGRPFWKLRPLQLLVTFLGVVMTAIVALALVISGPVARTVGDAVGLGNTAVTVWNYAKWPVLVLIVMAMVAVLYYIAPNVQVPKLRWISPGSILAVVIWIAASALFAFYVSNFGSYNKTYGSLAGVVVFLLWLWITNIAVLLGQELNAELERQRELESGEPGARKRVMLPPRDDPKT